MKKYKIGYALGVYDMFNAGHLNFLKRARELCEYLIVGVSTDDFAQADNHQSPIIHFEDRARIVRAVRYVDEVIPQYNKDIITVFQTLHFDVLFLGEDWQMSLHSKELVHQLALAGVEVVSISPNAGNPIKAYCANITAPDHINIGYTQGTFDLFHIGHLNLLEHAHEHCDYLIVGVNADALVADYKHKHPVVGECERAEVLGGMSVVDEVHIVTTLDKLDAHIKFNFNTIFIGDDWKGNPRWEQTCIEMGNIGVEVKFLPHTDGVSTTQLTKAIRK